MVSRYCRVLSNFNGEALKKIVQLYDALVIHSLPVPLSSTTCDSQVRGNVGAGLMSIQSGKGQVLEFSVLCSTHLSAACRIKYK
jgi:hypothetical protein